MNKVLLILLLCPYIIGQTIYAPKTIVIPKTTVSEGTTGSGTAPTFIADSTNSSFCVGVATCAAASFTPNTNDLIWVQVFTPSGTTINSPTDTCGTSGGASNTYTADSTNTTKGALFHTLVGFGKACVVTANIGTPAGNEIVYAQIWRGVNQTTPIFSNTLGNQASNGTGTDGVTSNAGTGTTISSNQSNDILAGAAVDCSGGPETISAGTGFTLTNTPALVGNCIVAGEQKTVATASSGLAATFTSNVSTFRMTSALVIQHP